MVRLSIGSILLTLLPFCLSRYLGWFNPGYKDLYIDYEETPSPYLQWDAPADNRTMDFPFAARIMCTYEHNRCMGALIQNDYILTSYQCGQMVQNKTGCTAELGFVRKYKTKSNWENDFALEIELPSNGSVLLHPCYHYYTPQQNIDQFSLALIRIPPIANPLYEPVQIPNEKDAKHPDQGYHMVSYIRGYGQPWQQMHHDDLPERECRSYMFKSNFYLCVDVTPILKYDSNYDRDGVPLFYDNLDGYYILAGVWLYEHERGTDGLGVFARVSKHKVWLSWALLGAKGELTCAKLMDITEEHWDPKYNLVEAKEEPEEKRRRTTTTNISVAKFPCNGLYFTIAIVLAFANFLPCY